MAQRPFRQSVDYEDDPNSQPQAEMPKSFISDENSANIPKSFIADEVKKPSVFSRAIEALKPAKSIHPTGSLIPGETAQRFLTGTSPEQEANLKKQGLNPQLVGESLME